MPTQIILLFFYFYRPYAYDVTEGRPAALGVVRHRQACSQRANPCMPYRRAGPGPRTDWEAERQCALPAQHVRAAWPPTWRRCYGDMTSMHKVYSFFFLFLFTFFFFWRHHFFFFFLKTPFFFFFFEDTIEKFRLLISKIYTQLTRNITDHLA